MIFKVLWVGTTFWGCSFWKHAAVSSVACWNPGWYVPPLGWKSKFSIHMIISDIFYQFFFQEYLTVWKKLRPIFLGMVNSCTSCASYRTYSGRICSEFCQGRQCSISFSLTCTGWQVSGTWKGLLNIMLCWFLFKSCSRDGHMLLHSFSNRSKRSFLKLTRSTKMCGHFQRHPCKIRLSDVSNETDQTQTLQADTSKANNCTAIYVAEISCSTITIMQSLLFKAALYSINYPEKLQLKHKTNTHTQKAEPRTVA